MKKTIGKCSRCGGNVQVVDGPWFGELPPPTCQKCGAVKKNSLPVIDMEPRAKTEEQRRADKIIAECSGGDGTELFRRYTDGDDWNTKR